MNSSPVRNIKGCDIAMVASDSNMQVGNLSASEACLGGHCPLPVAGSVYATRQVSPVLYRHPVVLVWNEFPGQFASQSDMEL